MKAYPGNSMAQQGEANGQWALLDTRPEEIQAPPEPAPGKPWWWHELSAAAEAETGLAGSATAVRSVTFVIEGAVDTRVTVTEQSDGTLLFDLEVLGAGPIGDLRALFFDLADAHAGLIDGLRVDLTGDVTGFDAGDDSVDSLGRGANIKGAVANELGKFDIGVAFGTPGIGTDDIRSASFVLWHDSEALTLDMISEQDIGLRLTSVGDEGGPREGSAKIGGAFPEVEGGGGPNEDPVAASDAIIATVSTDAVIPAAWLLQNDSDADGDMLTVTAIDSGAFAGGWVVTPVFSGAEVVSVTVTTPGTVVEPLVLSYTASDGHGGSATSTVTIGLAAPSTDAADSIDISAADYNFSFLDMKAGDDGATGGSEVAAPTSTGTVGSDLIIGGAGDDSVIGGNGDDTLYGGNLDGSDTTSQGNDIYGDGVSVHVAASATFAGGDDAINGADGSSNAMWGDAFFVFLDGDGAIFDGGDDVITGGNGSGAFNDLWGDAQAAVVAGPGGIGVAATIIGGNDTLISGTGASDVMRGDTNVLLGALGNLTVVDGADTFVFGEANGRDSIVDFQAGTDTVLLVGLGFTQFSDLDSYWATDVFGINLALDFDGADGSGHFGTGDVIIFEGYAPGSQAALAGDFDFAATMV